ncbi:ATP-binding protein [Streptomyces scopuliridis]|uniref:ATP-binding protein n=1 Tax=Streptomyces scopuliridis TaxID=452529 RepID=UPI002DD9C4A5|nr:ATP-binding protein [Streptomyces scopuliridis]WSB35802.1 ATP-binding protein [Streptomyces scopuliridis]
MAHITDHRAHKQPQPLAGELQARARHPWGAWCASVSRRDEGTGPGLRTRTHSHDTYGHDAYGYETYGHEAYGHDAYRHDTCGHGAHGHDAHRHDVREHGRHAAYRSAFTLPSRRDSVARARHWLRDELQRWRLHTDLCDVAVLVVSELFTNAVLHTASALISCEVRLLAEHVRLDVHDQGARDGAPSPRSPDSRAENGRGLLLVESLAEAWGVGSREGGVGRTVWAMLPLSHGSGA